MTLQPVSKDWNKVITVCCIHEYASGAFTVLDHEITAVKL